MPCFSIVARDYPDGLERRLAVRDQHIALSGKMIAEGKLFFGAAILEEGSAKGSILIGKFSSRTEIANWLAIEPYVTAHVWESWEIKEVSVGPSYVAIFPALGDLS